MPLIEQKQLTPVCDHCGKSGPVILVEIGQPGFNLPEGWEGRRVVDWKRYVFYNDPGTPTKYVLTCDTCSTSDEELGEEPTTPPR